MNNIYVPQINANENMYVLEELLFSDKAEISGGDTIAVLSSSKATLEVKTDYNGYFLSKVRVFDNVAVGDVLGIVFKTVNEMEKYLQENDGGKLPEYVGVDISYTLTKVAKAFAEEHGISEAEIASLGKRIVKTSDLEEILKNRSHNASNVQKLTVNQMGVANTVIKSHAKIPTAYLVYKVNCDNCEVLIRKMTEECGVPIGYGELLVFVVSGLIDKYPLFYAHLLDDNRVQIPTDAAVGITLDAGSGLFIPVLKDTTSLEAIMEGMFEYKKKALEGKFEADDLSGGNFTISLNPVEGVVSVLPIIVPDQAAILSVGMPVKELAFNNQNEVVEHNYLYLGLAYDHRINNGFQAMQFMRSVAEGLKSLA